MIARAAFRFGELGFQKIKERNMKDRETKETRTDKKECIG